MVVEVVGVQVQQEKVRMADQEVEVEEMARIVVVE